MKTTLKDIAQATGVSIAAVSKVLNQKPIRISDDKKKEILETAERLHYRVNQAARSLVTKQSGLLGLIVPDIENPYFSRLAKYLERHCLKDDRFLLILNSSERADTDLRLLDLLISRQVDGLFLCPSFPSLVDPLVFKKLQTLPFPLVLVDRVMEGLEANQVHFDNELGAYLATAHLIDQGHDRIGLIAPPIDAPGEKTRVEGYCRAFNERGLAIPEDLIFYGDYHAESGYLAGKAFLKTDGTALFSSNDRMTLGFLKALREAGKSIPEDCSLISNDSQLDDYTYGRPVTTVVQEVELLAREAYGLYIHSSDPTQKNIHSLDPRLIKRDSVVPNPNR